MKLTITNNASETVFETGTPSMIRGILGGLRLMRAKAIFERTPKPEQVGLITEVENDFNRQLAQLGL